MITLQTLADNLTQMLNGELDANLYGYNLDKVLPNTIYRFYVAADEGNYKRNHISDLNPNLEIRYINALLTVNNSSNEGVNSEDYVGTMETTLDVMIPDLYIVDDATGNSVLPKIVRQLLTEVLQYNQSSMQSMPQEVGGDGLNYLVGIDYNIATTGTAQIRHQVGESLTMAVYIDFTFVSAGIASNAIKMYFKDGNDKVRLYAAQLGIARKCTLESNTGTGSGKNAVTNEVDNTVMTINGNLAVRNLAFCRKAFEFVVNETISPLEVTVEICPTPTDSNPIAFNTFTMIFSECGINSEPPYAASMSFVLVEAPEEV